MDGNGRLHRFLLHYTLASTADHPDVVRRPGRTPYAYWDATPQFELTTWALEEAVRVEVSNEVGYLRIFDEAKRQIEAEVDMPSKDIGLLIRQVLHQDGHLSKHRRKQFSHVPEKVLDRIQEIVRTEMETHKAAKLQ